jgi:hypothetical protein
VGTWYHVAGTIDSSVPGSPHVMSEGDSRTFEVYASDADGDPLAYTWVLDGAVILTGSPSFTWIAPVGSAGEHRLTVGVTDGHGGLDGVTRLVLLTAALGLRVLGMRWSRRSAPPEIGC